MVYYSVARKAHITNRRDPSMLSGLMLIVVVLCVIAVGVAIGSALSSKKRIAELTFQLQNIPKKDSVNVRQEFEAFEKRVQAYEKAIGSRIESTISAMIGEQSSGFSLSPTTLQVSQQKLQLRFEAIIDNLPQSFFSDSLERLKDQAIAGNIPEEKLRLIGSKLIPSDSDIDEYFDDNEDDLGDRRKDTISEQIEKVILDEEVLLAYRDKLKARLISDAEDLVSTFFDTDSYNENDDRDAILTQLRLRLPSMIDEIIDDKEGSTRKKLVEAMASRLITEIESDE